MPHLPAAHQEQRADAEEHEPRRTRLGHGRGLVAEQQEEPARVAAERKVEIRAEAGDADRVEGAEKITSYDFWPAKQRPDRDNTAPRTKDFFIKFLWSFCLIINDPRIPKRSYMGHLRLQGNKKDLAVSN